MEQLKNIFDLSKFDGKTKVIWWTYFVLSSAIIVWSFLGITSFTLSQAIFLAVACAVAFIGRNLIFKVPQTGIVLWLRESLILLSLIWLNSAGVIFLVGFASIALSKQFSKSIRRNSVLTTSGIIATFLASLFFNFVIKTVGEIDYLTSPTMSLPILFVALTITALLHYLVNTALYLTFLGFRTEEGIFIIWKETFFWGIATYGIALVSAFATHIFFLQFGTPIGFLFIPLVFALNLASRFYNQTLETKDVESTETSRIHLATIEALATAIDARDQVGVGHARRVQIYAIGMGEVLGLSDDEIQALRTGALLHDIGKLAVPDHILNKPGRLTPAEMEKTKIHSTVGASILEKVNFPYPVVPTVLFHHESWDGSGYPQGLSKEEIPLTARIIAVADAYDTLRGARPYRTSLSREEARRCLRNESGKQYDPRLVETFLRYCNTFEQRIEEAGLSYNLENRDKFEHEVGIESANNQFKGSYVEQIKRANREVYTLYELARIFSGSLSIDETLKLFVAKVRELVPFDTCVIYLYNEKEKTAVATYVEGVNAESIENKRIKEGEGATGYVLKNRQSVHNINPALDFSFSYSHIAEDFTSMASLPLIANEKLIGAISLYSSRLESYEDDYMRLLETITRIASDAISKSVTHAETENRALTDPMTGLPNARSLQTHFEQEVARARRTGSPLQLIMLDLDGFKAVNDNFGHKVGDKLLLEVGKVMKAQLRDYDFLARYAGDEFVAIIPEVNEEEIAELCDRIEKAVNLFYIPVADSMARVGISIGSACFPMNGETLDHLIVAADQGMYAVKAKHKQKQREKEAKALEERQIKELESAVKVMPEELIIGDDAVIFDLDESHIIANNHVN